MGIHRITVGLDLPISGQPEQKLHKVSGVTRVAVLNGDYPHMKPRMMVNVGDEVKTGQVLFEDRKAEGVRFTAPGGGKVAAINRGAKRIFQSLVIELASSEEHVEFEHWKGANAEYDGDEMRALVNESGLWTSFRQRPFGSVPPVASTCRSIFVTAIDTNPLAADVEVALEGRSEDFQRGLEALSKLTEGPVFLCKKEGSSIKGSGSRVSEESFSGPHPAGLAGTHIHMLDPASNKKTVWSIGYQDVAAIGALLSTGRLDTTRRISLAGPSVAEPRLIETRLGADIPALVAGQTQGEAIRIISGSVLAGHTANDEIFGFLGRYHNQISCIPEDKERVFLGWLSPGLNKFSTVRTILGGWLSKKFNLTTTTHGGHRAIVPIGMFERVMPLDVMPTFLVRSLSAQDLERSEELGCLELIEEDLALCTFVSPGKNDFGASLRRMLTTIWKEG
jgi:Na+-transporting NADH:ubiquinone oxidoreductase subunit A